jgi:hypothetical protein
MNMQRPDVQDDNTRDHERQEIVERKEAIEGRVIDRVAAPQPSRNRIADNGNRREGW